MLIHPYFHDSPTKQYQYKTYQLPRLFDFASLNNKKNKTEISYLENLYNLKSQNTNKSEELSLKSKDKTLGLEVMKEETKSSSTDSEMI